jgi:hypothetical protein
MKINWHNLVTDLIGVLYDCKHHYQLKETYNNTPTIMREAILNSSITEKKNQHL